MCHRWVCNVVSAMLIQMGRQPLVMVTARGGMAAHRILAVEGCIQVRDEQPYPDGNSVMSV